MILNGGPGVILEEAVTDVLETPTPTLVKKVVEEVAGESAGLTVGGFDVAQYWWVLILVGGLLLLWLVNKWGKTK